MCNIFISGGEDTVDGICAYVDSGHNVRHHQTPRTESVAEYVSDTHKSSFQYFGEGVLRLNAYA